MNRNEILNWNQKYEREEELYNESDEEELGEKFRQNKHITKDDLVRVIKWKFQGKLIGRQKRVLKLLEDKFGERLRNDFAFGTRLAVCLHDLNWFKDGVKLYFTYNEVAAMLTFMQLGYYENEALAYWYGETIDNAGRINIKTDDIIEIIEKEGWAYE